MRLRSLALLLALAGCADDNVSLFITGMAIPTVDEGACSFQPSTVTLATGLYDPSRGDSYLLSAIVQNQLVPRANEVRPETNGVFVTDAIVNIIETNGGTSVSEFRVPATGFIPPGGQGVVSLEAIPSTIPVPAGQLILEISLLARTQGEIDIETGSFNWPVVVCGGCLFPACEMPTMDGEIPESLGVCAPGSNFPLIEACP